MGSSRTDSHGREAIYKGTRGSSQPYAPYYKVDPKMHYRDEARGISKNNVYTKNPTAKNISEMIHGNYIGDKKTNNTYTYVIDKNGNIIVGQRNGNGKGPNKLPTPHPTLIGGKNPKAVVAGMLEIRGGKIYSVDNQSGHFKPHQKSMHVALEKFGNLPGKLFHKNFKGF